MDLDSKRIGSLFRWGNELLSIKIGNDWYKILKKLKWSIYSAIKLKLLEKIRSY